MQGSSMKRIGAATTAERPKAAKASIQGSLMKQIIAATTAERPKAAKAQVVGVGPHDN